jgi:hypothetical protein
LHWDFWERPVRAFKILTLIFAAIPVFATSVVNFSVEPMSALKKSYINNKDVKWQWLFSGEYGWMLSDHVVWGASITFARHLEKNRDPEKTYRIYSKERVVMFPVSMFTVIDPIPQYVVHPAVHIALGYNSVVISSVNYEKKDSIEIEKIGENDGYYNGFYTKFGMDCMFDIGKKTSLFVGPQWQISTTERRGGKEVENGVYEHKFNGFGLRLGVSVLL